jgi:hypothetical protein
MIRKSQACCSGVGPAVGLLHRFILGLFAATHLTAAHLSSTQTFHYTRNTSVRFVQPPYLSANFGCSCQALRVGAEFLAVSWSSLYICKKFIYT